MSLDTMKQALEALEQYTNVVTSVNDPNSWVTVSDGGKPARDAITALRAAIEQAQEPVAWQVMVEDEAMKEFPIKDMAHDWCAKKKLSGSPSAYWIRPLYTAPRQWQGLTDEEIKIIWRDIDGSEGMLMRFARAIEAKLREKNA